MDNGGTSPSKLTTKSTECPMDLLRSLTRVAVIIAIVATAGASLSTAHGLTAAIVDVRTFGATGDGVTNDTSAFQAANDHLATLGGGTLHVPTGTYLVKGLEQSSGVTISGNRSAVLKHPDGTGSIVNSAASKTGGSVLAGSDLLTVVNARGARPGVLVAVRGAGGASPAQSTTLASSISAASEPLYFTRYAGFPTATFVLIDDEVVGYARNAEGKLATSRGLLGTTATSHDAGAPVSQLSYHVTTVRSVVGKAITLEKPAPFGVKNTWVYFGSTDLGLEGLTLDGSRPGRGSAGSTAEPVYYWLARRAHIRDTLIRNGDHGAVSFDLGTTESTIEDNELIDNGSPTGMHGSALWLFRGSSGNTVRNNVISGDGYNGILVDDRTQMSSEWDRPSASNVIERNTIEIGTSNSAAILVLGSGHNVIDRNVTRTGTYGIRVEASQQGLQPLDAVGNTITGNAMTGHSVGIRVTGSGNTFVANSVAETPQPTVDLGTDNRFMERWPTTTSIGARSPGSRFGEAVTFDVSVSDHSDGSVRVTVDGETHGEDLALDENGHASFTLTELAVGDHVVGANFLGDDLYAPSDASTSHTVSPVASTTTIERASTSLSASTLGRSETRPVARLTDARTGAPIAGRTLVFLNKHKTLCRSTTDEAGVGTCKLTPRRRGRLGRSFAVRFAGDANRLAASATGVAR